MVLGHTGVVLDPRPVHVAQLYVAIVRASSALPVCSRFSASS